MFLHVSHQNKKKEKQTLEMKKNSLLLKLYKASCVCHTPNIQHTYFLCR